MRPAASVETQIFVGRSEELQLLRRALRRSRKRALGVLVRGESGVGKSTLIRYFTDEVVERDPEAVVLAGRCYERESVPFKAFDGVVDALSRHLLRAGEERAAALLPPPRELSALRRVFPVLSRVPAIAATLEPDTPPGVGPSPHELRRRAFSALRHVLGRLADAGPLVLCIDDLQWADTDSLLLLDDVLQPPDAPRALFLASLRQGAPPLPGEVLELRLETLSPEAAQKLAALCARDPQLARIIAEEARGHPLFIIELGRAAQQPSGLLALPAASASAGGRAETAVRLDHALWARVSALDPPARRLVEVVAVAGEPIAQGVAAEAAGLSPSEGERWVSRLRSAHLCRTLGPRPQDGIEPYHARVRESVLARLDPARVRAIDRAIAEVLERTGAAEDAPHLLVRHFSAAGELRRAARYAEPAAQRAAKALAFDQAADLYRAALELGDPGPEKALELRLQLAEAQAHAGRGPLAAATYLEVASATGPGAPDAAVRLRCQSEAARHLIGSGHLDEGLQVVRQVLTALGGSWPSSDQEALARLGWNRARLALRRLSFKPRRAEEVPPVELLKLDAYDHLATSLAVIDPVVAAGYQTQALRLALDAGEPGRIGRALAKEACFVATRGRATFERAMSIVERVAELARSGDPELRAWESVARGTTQFLAGGYAAALTQLADAERRFAHDLAQSGHFAELVSIRLLRLYSALHVGWLGELERSAIEYVRDAVRRGDRHAETSFTRAFAIVWLMRDEPDELRRRLAACTWVPRTEGLHQQHLYELFARSDLALYTNDLAEMQATLAGLRPVDRTLIARAQTNRCFARWARGRLALALARAGVEPEAHLAEALEQVKTLLGERVVYADLWARLVRAGVRSIEGRPEEAAADLAAVANAAGPLELYLHVAHDRLGVVRPGPEADEKQRAAEAFFVGQGVRDVPRLCGVLAPV